jgi:hypothetical protein
VRIEAYGDITLLKTPSYTNLHDDVVRAEGRRGDRLLVRKAAMNHATVMKESKTDHK